VSEILLHPSLLFSAYIQGYFPLPDPDSGEIVWLRPDPRAVIPLNQFHCSRSLKRRLNRNEFTVSYDRDFRGVMEGCADRKESWITQDFFSGYGKLFEEGFAHSVEIWQQDRLVGGLYGVAINGAFFGESMFHRTTDASKAALFFLVSRLNALGFSLLEVQYLTSHLVTLGAIEISDRKYQRLLKAALLIETVWVRE
jgi:leucyl/phenylalanyl-tRNA--protein transferase